MADAVSDRAGFSRLLARILVTKLRSLVLTSAWDLSYHSTPEFFTSAWGLRTLLMYLSSVVSLSRKPLAQNGTQVMKGTIAALVEGYSFGELFVERCAARHTRRTVGAFPPAPAIA